MAGGCQMSRRRPRVSRQIPPKNSRKEAGVTTQGTQFPWPYTTFRTTDNLTITVLPTDKGKQWRPSAPNRTQKHVLLPVYPL
eukprot:4196654-Amphidinium_carterae.1